MKLIKYILLKLHKFKLSFLKMKYRNKSSSCLKWGLIGTGYMSDVFANTIEISEHSEIVSVCSRKKDKLEHFKKNHLFYKGYTDRKSFYNDKTYIDIIYVATPVQTHFSIIKECIQNGYDVLCEKPIVTNIEELTELLNILEDKNSQVFEAMWVKCLPTVRKVKTIIDNNELGILKQIDVKLCKNDKNKKLSVMLNYGMYCLNLITYLIDENLSILNCNVDYINNNDVTWNISLSSNQTKINIEISSIYKKENNATFNFEEGVVELPNQFNRTNYIVIKDKNHNIEKLRYKYINYGFEYELAEIEKYYKEAKRDSCLQINNSYRNYKLLDDLYKFTVSKSNG